MNKLNDERQLQIVDCLIEGNSIRSTERMTNTHRDTTMRLLVTVGGGCVNIMNLNSASKIRQYSVTSYNYWICCVFSRVFPSLFT